MTNKDLDDSYIIQPEWDMLPVNTPLNIVLGITI